jgi:hypothetical protein
MVMSDVLVGLDQTSAGIELLMGGQVAKKVLRGERTNHQRKKKTFAFSGM